MSGGDLLARDPIPHLGRVAKRKLENQTPIVSKGKSAYPKSPYVFVNDRIHYINPKKMAEIMTRKTLNELKEEMRAVIRGERRASPVPTKLWERLAIDEKALRLARQALKQAEIYVQTAELHLAETKKAVIKAYGAESKHRLQKLSRKKPTLKTRRT